MSQFLRTLGVAVVAAALLDASAGLCFCHRGPVAPGSSPAPHGCCHGQDAAGTPAVQAAGSCCHIEAAARDITPTDAVQLAQPPTGATRVDTVLGQRLLPQADVAAFAPSSPLRALRI